MNICSIADALAEKISGEWGVEPTRDSVYVLRTTNFTNEGRINFDKVVKREIDEKKVQKKRLKFGDIIIEKSGGSPAQPVGRVVIFDKKTDERYLCNNFTSILRPKKGVEPKYLFYYLFFFHLTGRTLRYQNKTTGIINLKLDRYLYTEKIQLPSMEEQKRIVSLLDQADAIRRKRKESKMLMDEYIQAVFMEIFSDPMMNPKGWEKKQIKDVAQIKMGPFGSLLHKQDYVINGIPLVNPKHLIDKKIEVDERCSITPAKIHELEQYRLRKGDVILGRRGEIGRCGLVGEKEDGYLCGTGSMFIRPDASVDPLFLVYLISTPQVSRELESKAVGITMKNLSATIVKRFIIPIPPIKLQNKFSDIVSSKDGIMDCMHAQSYALENQFHTIMQHAFSNVV